MLNENLTNTGADFAYFRERVYNLARDQVESAPTFFQMYDLLEYFHFIIDTSGWACLHIAHPRISKQASPQGYLADDVGFAIAHKSNQFK